MRGCEDDFTLIFHPFPDSDHLLPPPYLPNCAKDLDRIGVLI